MGTRYTVRQDRKRTSIVQPRQWFPRFRRQTGGRLLRFVRVDLFRHGGRKVMGTKNATGEILRWKCSVTGDLRQQGDSLPWQLR